MGTGPSDVHPHVLAAMARPAIGHLDPAFVEMMEELKTLPRAETAARRFYLEGERNS